MIEINVSQRDARKLLLKQQGLLRDNEIDRVGTEMSLHVLAYNMKRMMNIIGTKTLIEAIRA
jgi:hypothetical protein